MCTIIHIYTELENWFKANAAKVNWKERLDAAKQRCTDIMIKTIEYSRFKSTEKDLNMVEDWKDMPWTIPPDVKNGPHPSYNKSDKEEKQMEEDEKQKEKSTNQGPKKSNKNNNHNVKMSYSARYNSDSSDDEWDRGLKTRKKQMVQKRNMVTAKHIVETRGKTELRFVIYTNIHKYILFTN